MYSGLHRRARLIVNGMKIEHCDYLILCTHVAPGVGPDDDDDGRAVRLHRRCDCSGMISIRHTLSDRRRC